MFIRQKSRPVKIVKPTAKPTWCAVEIAIFTGLLIELSSIYLAAITAVAAAAADGGGGEVKRRANHISIFQ